LTRRLHDLIGDKEQRLLVISDTPAFVTGQLSQLPAQTETFECGGLLELSPRKYRPLIDSFDGCLVVLLGEDELTRGRPLLARIRPLLKAQGFIMVVVVNGRGSTISHGFHQRIVSSATQFLDMETWLSEVHFISASWLRLAIIRTMVKVSSAVTRRPFLYFPFAMIVSAVLAPLSLACNWSAIYRGSAAVKPGAQCSSVCMELHPSSAAAALPVLEAEKDHVAKIGLYGT
jgi:hypothetical protein